MTFRLLLAAVCCLLESRQATAQPEADSLANHWPAVVQSAYDPVQVQRLLPLMDRLLRLPVAGAPERLPAVSRVKELPGWPAFSDAALNREQRAFILASAAAERALDTARHHRDRHLEMRTLSLIGDISREAFLGASLKAVPFHEQALALAIALRDTTYMIREMVALADNYGQAGRNDKFLEYALQAARLLHRFDVPQQRLRLGSMVGSFVLGQGNAPLAEQTLRKAMSLAESLADTAMIRHLRWQLFDAGLVRGDAIRAAEQLEAIRAGDPGLTEDGLQEAYYRLARLRGERDKALYHLERAYRNVGEDYLRRSAEQLAGWETRLQTREKALQLETQNTLLLSQQRTRKILSGMIVLISASLAVALVAWFRQRQSRQSLSRQNGIVEQQASELKELDRFKSRFFANISHELRTPLTLILGPLDLVLRKTILDNHTRHMLLVVRRNAARLLGLVNDILDLSRVEVARLTVTAQPTRVLDFLEDIVGDFRHLAESQGISLVLDYSAAPAWTLLLDRGKVFGILSNLLSNALKFTPAGGKVVVYVRAAESDGLWLEVRDTGSGIAPDDLPHIFERYYQTRHQDARVSGGAGIGLTLSLELAQVMGGRLWAESPPGGGSMFTLVLPAQSSRPEVAEPIQHSMRQPAPAALAVVAEDAPLLLVAEDNPDMQTFLRNVLQASYRLVVVRNGQGVLDYLQQPSAVPDLILTDLMMPGMDGLQLLEALRGAEAWRSIPVLMLTARAESADRLRAFRIGLDDYLLKPFEPEELLVRVRNVLRNQANRREWREALQEPGVAAGLPGANQWVNQLEACVRENLADFQFNVDRLSELMHTNRKALYRSVREATGMSVNQYIQEIRLQKAREILEAGQATNLRDLAISVGFRTSDYFSRLYRERFGRSPADYHY